MALSERHAWQSDFRFLGKPSDWANGCNGVDSDACWNFDLGVDNRLSAFRTEANIADINCR
jgi:hypothetical protein